MRPELDSFGFPELMTECELMLFLRIPQTKGQTCGPMGPAGADGVVHGDAVG